MKAMKGIISVIIVLVLLIGMVPTKSYAKNVESTVENMDTTVEGTNSFGMLLSEDIQGQQAVEENYSGGYNVIGLTIENGVATVRYDSLEEAILVVAIYTEDGLQLLVSGNTVVQPEDSEVAITLEGEIPEYFMASAYLLDTYDYSPLCSSYSTPMYTREMQELLASTTEDYAADRVLNLDEDKTTNFAVYADTTKVLEYTEGVNTVISADDETATYVIGNADSNITGLQTGDVLAYTYGENQLLIVKVVSVSVDGTTATITGGDLEMEEVFSHVKIESNGETQDITVDETTGDEDITYVGMVSDEAAVMSLSNPYAVDPIGDYTGKLSLGFELEKEGESLSYSGSLKLNLKVDFSYYVSTSRQFVELEIDTKTKLAFKISGEAEFTKALPSLNFSPIPAVSIGFKPELVLKFTAEVELSLSVGSTTGFSYENGKGVKNLSTSPKVELDLDAEGKVFFGLDLGPAVWILDGHIAEIKFSALAGVELKAEMSGTAFDEVQIVGGTEIQDSIHTCESCMEITLSAKTEFSLKLEFLNLSFLKIEFKLTDKVFEIGECYYSFDQQDFGWGSCPNISYRVTVYVKNAQGQDAFGVDVVAGWAEQWTEIPMGTTNSNGVVVDYLQAGTYTFMATVDGENLGKVVKVEEACKITLEKDSLHGRPTFISDIKNSDSVTDAKIVASGACGANGANVNWTLDAAGTLTIFGTGKMMDYDGDDECDDVPWNSNSFSVKRVVIKDGVTRIGTYAFFYCRNLSAVTIPDSVTSIGGAAFGYCSSLTSVTIPDSVTSIGGAAFGYCSSLTSVTIPDSVTSIDEYAFCLCSSLTSITIPDSVTSIGNCVFEGCKGLTRITIPDSVTSIGYAAFNHCSSLTGIWVNANNGYYSNDESGVLFNKDQTELIAAPGALSGNYEIPDSVTSIGGSAFYCCEGLTSVTIPDSVTSIGGWTFGYCSSLTSITIPDGVASIGGFAFCYCTGLASVTIPDSVTNIGEHAFWRCNSLTSITIPDSVTSIGISVFYGCEGLTSVTIPDSVTSIGDSAFGYCSSLTSISIPDSVTSIGDRALSGCTSLTRITIPDSVTSIGNGVFEGCKGLTRITIPDSVTSIGDRAFSGCNSLTGIWVDANNSYYSNDNYGVLLNKDKTELIAAPGAISGNYKIPDSVTIIGDRAFSGCTSLTRITIPDSVTSIGDWAFSGCTSLTEIYFEGNAPRFGWHVFSEVTATAYYPVGNETWTEDVMQDYDGTITWVPYTVGQPTQASVNTASAPVMASADMDEQPLETTVGEVIVTSPALCAAWGGEYDTEETDTYTLKTASFSGLVPGAEYVLLALVSIEVEDVLAPDNLLYIEQGTAGEDGTLVFRYVQREVHDLSYVMACGASANDLSDATITFPTMAATEEIQAVNPTVVYNGEILTEGVDYVVVGTVNYTTAGEYTCYIRGIYNYTGLVQCKYTVLDTASGDANGDGRVDTTDAKLIMQYDLRIIDETALNLAVADVNGDGKVDTTDAKLIMQLDLGIITEFPKP